MKPWEYVTVAVVVLAACAYLVIYIRREIVSRKTSCENCEEKTSFCNACGNKECPMSTAKTCKKLEEITEQNKKETSYRTRLGN